MRDVKEDTKKIVRILLRVSSDQQLEADGDLSIQRQLVVEEVKKHEEWILDSKEYFEGSNSGYKNSVVDRDVLQEALRDAENKEYDILLAYKDDRLGRRMLEIPMYIMSLKQFGVDVYTVKDGLLTPDIGDVMGMLRLTMQYGMAEKSSPRIRGLLLCFTHKGVCKIVREVFREGKPVPVKAAELLRFRQPFLHDHPRHASAGHLCKGRQAG